MLSLYADNMITENYIGNFEFEVVHIENKTRKLNILESSCCQFCKQ